MELIITNSDPWVLPELAPQNERASLILEWIEMNWDGCLFDHLPSEKSRRSEKSNGKHFMRFLAITELKPNVLQLYAKFLNDQKEKVPLNTLSARGRAARTILSQVAYFREDLLPPNIMFKMKHRVKWTEEDDSVKTGLSEEEILSIENHISSMDDSLDKFKYWCMHVLFRYQGLRIDELARIKVSHINFSDNQIKLLRKKGNKKPVILYDEAVKWIRKYLSYSGIKRGFLFPSKATKTGHISKRQLYKIFNSIFLGCDIKNRTPHSYRHFLGSWVCRNSNGNPVAICQALGNKNLTSAQPYIDAWVSEQEHKKLNEIVNKNNPIT